MRQQFLGALIGAAFGAVFVVVNSGPPLPAALGWVLRALAVLALAAVVVLGLRAGGRPTLEGRPVFGPSYRVIVIGEVVLLVAGFFVLTLLEAPVEANVAWIATIVGLHFVALAWAWKTRSILVVGAVLTVLGVVGLALLGSAAEWVPFVSGVLSGVTLLGGSLHGVRRA
ncbi:hypothetical protein [Amycolatopsis sp. SID8362]|uniref:hypothetical protein n=1 Tax=Amycolatopsis sp. SID8362 TaxID=2690346 RepID=UPI00136BFDAE|nr:hypothetical protein [Amycolatopsis sp. SID8362]NBH05829.1 hypothetical protein [Amycolatopsis sp. SID8362]NED42527.1 hypothetical protein [Amycolatopsis sp. SID8362]